MKLRTVPPDPEIIEWLWSEEGEAWHRRHVKQVRHSTGAFAVIKDDHECEEYAVLCGIRSSSTYPDDQIMREIRAYGLSGVPGEWKQ